MTRPMAARLTARPPRPNAIARPDPSIDASLRTSQALDRARMVREVVDRAKGLLMAQEGFSEPEAFRRLQKTSMDTRTPMVKVAEAVLLADEVRRPDWRP
jgi:hypothetical protein